MRSLTRATIRLAGSAWAAGTPSRTAPSEQAGDGGWWVWSRLSYGAVLGAKTSEESAW